MANPLSNFLTKAEATMEISIRATQLAALDTSRFAAFTHNAEDRGYASDMVNRVRALSFCYDRLCGLTPIFHEIQSTRQKNQRHPTVLEREQQWHTESEAITLLAFYELKSLADMLKQWGIQVPTGSELDYLLKARDKFLAHPQLHKVTRKVPNMKGIPVYGGMTQVCIVSSLMFDSITQAHYLGELGLAGSVDEEAQQQINKRLILSGKKHENFNQMEITRLKAFGIPEPELEKSLQEVAALLEQKALPLIKQCFDVAVNDFGCERR